MWSQFARRRKSKDSRKPSRTKFLKAFRRPLLEVLEARQMLTGSQPYILGLSTGNSALYEGETLALSASIDPNTTATQVKFYLDSNHDGVLETGSGGDTLLGTTMSGTENTWTLSNISTTDNSIGLGKQLFFAQATNSSGGAVSNVVSIPAEILSPDPVVEPIDNDQIVGGREYVQQARTALPPSVDDSIHYSLTVSQGATTFSSSTSGDSTTWSAIAGLTFHASTGTIIWNTSTSQGSSTPTPYHFEITATDQSTSASSAPREFYLTVVNSAQSLSSASLSDSSAPILGPFNHSSGPIFYDYAQSQPMGTGAGVAASIGPSVNSSLGLSYNTASYGYTIVEADVPVNWLSNTTATFLKAEVSILSHDGSTTVASTDPVYYSMAGVSADQYFHLALPVDTSSLDTGEYQVNVHLTFLDSSGGQVGSAQDFGSASSAVNAQVPIVNRSSSTVGPGWAIAGLDQLLTSYSDGVMLIHGDGTTQWFAKDASAGTYAAGMEVVAGTFHWIAQNGAYEKFNLTTGKLLAQVDMVGNTTTYTYYSSGSGPLESVTDPTGRTRTFTYTDGLLTGVEDFAGRTTTLSYDTSGRLSEIVKPDDSTQQFAYDEATNLLASQTNELGQTTHYRYDDFGRLVRTIFPDGSSQFLESSDTGSMARRVIVSYDDSTPVYLGSTRALAAPLLKWNIDSFGPHVGSNTFMGAMGRIVDPAGNVVHFTTFISGATSSITQPVTDSSTSPWEQGPTRFSLYNPSTERLRATVTPTPQATTLSQTVYAYDDNLLTSVTLPNMQVASVEWNYGSDGA